MNKKGGIIAAWIVLALCSCHNRDGNTSEDAIPDQASELYESTLRLISLYTDSIEHATDSTQVEDIFARFNARLDSLNFAVPPDTDLRLSEGENDTLYINIENLRHLHDSRLRGLKVVKNDTCQQSMNL